MSADSIGPTALRAWRDETSATLTDVAREIGVSRFQVANWEGGNSVPRPKTRALLAELLGRDDVRAEEAWASADELRRRREPKAADVKRVRAARAKMTAKEG